ncbi:MAG TPA: hypothetical protein VD816_07595 [Ohtaekwangia sp.]|nr:hypothetical protein [Ohtaekwangia sp.]
MKAFFHSRCGLTARQRATRLTAFFSPAARVATYLLIVSALLSSCHESTNGQDKNEQGIVQDSSVSPKVSIKVNKQFDDQGNIVGFDSTYTSYYSNMTGDTARMDSLMNSFNRYFDLNHSSFFRNEFNPLFFDDSLRYPDFFHPDFFMRRYELNDQYLRGMMKRMDSIKNRFYREGSSQGGDLRDL